MQFEPEQREPRMVEYLCGAVLPEDEPHTLYQCGECLREFLTMARVPDAE